MKITILLLYILTASIFLFSCNSAAEKKQESNALKNGLKNSDFSFRKLTPEEEKFYSQAAREYYEKHLGRAGFNGSILIAKNGQIIFEDYKGFQNFKTKDTITPNTPFHLASISKTFTGMAILKLWEQGRISLNDSIQKFFPGLAYPGVTVRMLLSHRSGLPNYLYFMDKNWDKKQKATNEDVINFMMVNKPQASNLPDKRFNYCNTNFVLLASILERITHIAFPQYMKDSVFTPLGMNSSFVFSISDTAKYVPTYAGHREYEMDHLDCTYGDKNIYSTVRDMLLWDKSLYQHNFVTKATLDSAFTPRSNEVRSMHNYGYAWRIFTHNNDTLIYHNGKWHGSNTVFTRLVQDTVTIIVLGNKFNKSIYQAREMGEIFTGEEDKLKLEE